MYSQPDISYTYISKTAADGTEITEINLEYDVKLFSAFNMESFHNLTPDVGLDFGLGLEYPLFPMLDLGIDMIHIPLVPAVLRNFMRIKGSAGIGDTVDIINIDVESLFSFDSDDVEYGIGKQTIIRPLKMLVFADFHPFQSKVLSFMPRAGFSYNPLFLQPFSPEYGLKMRLDLLNIFIANLGVHYEDRLWKNSFALALNFRVIQIDLGVTFQSQDFIKSWQGGGLGALVGLRFGL